MTQKPWLVKRIVSPVIKGIIRWLTYDHSKQHGAVECIQYCQRSSHLALSRCCKTENVQGTLRHTPNRQTAGKDKFQQSSHTKLVIWKQTSGWRAVVKSSNTEKRRRSTAPSGGVSVNKAHSRYRDPPLDALSDHPGFKPELPRSPATRHLSAINTLGKKRLQRNMCLLKLTARDIKASTHR